MRRGKRAIKRFGKLLFVGRIVIATTLIGGLLAAGGAGAGPDGPSITAYNRARTVTVRELVGRYNGLKVPNDMVVCWDERTEDYTRLLYEQQVEKDGCYEG